MSLINRFGFSSKKQLKFDDKFIKQIKIITLTPIGSLLQLPSLFFHTHTLVLSTLSKLHY